MERKKLTREQVEQIVIEAREKGVRPDLREVDLSKANLFEANLSGADLIETNLFEANLSGANLFEVNLSQANLFEANLSGADLSRAILLEANLSRANLSGANLSRAILLEANLNGTNLNGGDLSGANLTSANLIQADLSRANLFEANLGMATLSRVDLSGANLTKATLGLTTFSAVDLSTVKGLETVKQFGPSFIDFHTAFLSKSQIPEIFLRGAGVPETLITYLPSLLGQAIQFYSCFISYSSKDQAFAERLHADLQSKGVRCWFAPEDMKIGDEIRPAIDQSIRLHDKLLLILSEHSVASHWVKHEVEHAFELEIQRGELVLFPIRLDDTVMSTNTGWVGNIRRGRHIGDFTGWKDHDAYQKAFQRLLRDLSPETAPPLPAHIQAQARDREVESLRKQLARHQSNLNKLKEQAAIYAAGEKPLYLLNQIEAEEDTIEEIAKKISEL